MHGNSRADLPAAGSTTTLDGPLLVTIPKAQEVLGGIGRRELYNRIEAGDVERVKIGKRAFITRSSIEAYVERLRQEAAERLAAIRGSAAS